MSYDTDLIEKKFRDMRKITVPEGSVGRGRKANIDAIRNVLQNWGNLENINKNIVPSTMLSKYKKYIEAFMVGDVANCPKRYAAIIEQYKEYIQNIKAPESQTQTKSDCCSTTKKTRANKQPSGMPAVFDFVSQLKELGVSEFMIKF